MSKLCCDCEYCYPLLSLPLKYTCAISGEYVKYGQECHIELAPVVRCKDCRFWEHKKYKSGEWSRCDRLPTLCKEYYLSEDLEPDENFFCAFGERRGDTE